MLFNNCLVENHGFGKFLETDTDSPKSNTSQHRGTCSIYFYLTKFQGQVFFIQFSVLLMYALNAACLKLTAALMGSSA